MGMERKCESPGIIPFEVSMTSKDAAIIRSFNMTREQFNDEIRERHLSDRGKAFASGVSASLPLPVQRFTPPASNAQRLFVREHATAPAQTAAPNVRRDIDIDEHLLSETALLERYGSHAETGTNQTLISVWL